MFDKFKTLLASKLQKVRGPKESPDADETADAADTVLAAGISLQKEGDADSADADTGDSLGTLLLPKPKKAEQRLGEFLLQKGLITEVQLALALAEQKVTFERLGVILTRSNFINRNSLVEAIVERDPEQIRGEAHFSMRVPPEVLRELQTMIVAETADVTYIASPLPEVIVKQRLEQYYPDRRLMFVAYSTDHLDRYMDELDSIINKDESPLDQVLHKAFAHNASDIHIEPKRSSYCVFFRVLGVRQHVHEGSLDEYNQITARIKDLARMDLAERRVPQDGGFNVEYNGKSVDLRVSVIPTGNGEKTTIRVLDSDKVQPSLSLLGITRVNEWRSGVTRPDGICLICGPTGSGKTNTLNASVKELDRFGRAIYSAEDPIEFTIPYVNQVNINSTVGLDFARAVRAFMRADPDIILVGEIRDPETASNAVKAAETGHLVLATLHTGSIYEAVSRLRHLDVPDYELTYLLRSVLVQRLIRTLCPHCKGSGCPVCFKTGYTGRTVVSECNYFRTVAEVRKLVDGERWWPNMVDDCIAKVESGITNIPEAVRVFGVTEVQDAITRRRESGEVCIVLDSQSDKYF